MKKRDQEPLPLDKYAMRPSNLFLSNRLTKGIQQSASYISTNSVGSLHLFNLLNLAKVYFCLAHFVSFSIDKEEIPFLWLKFGQAKLSSYSNCQEIFSLYHLSYLSHF